MRALVDEVTNNGTSVLAPGGLLIIGARRRLPADFYVLRPVPSVAGAFQKLPSPALWGRRTA